jgi:hypothetical protein
MQSVHVWEDEPRKNKPASEAPLRLCVTFSGNGFHEREWGTCSAIAMARTTPRLASSAGSSCRMMDKMEVRPKTFGDAQKMLEEV